MIIDFPTHLKKKNKTLIDHRDAIKPLLRLVYVCTFANGNTLWLKVFFSYFKYLVLTGIHGTSRVISKDSAFQQRSPCSFLAI